MKLLSLHATCVEVNGIAVLIKGEPGAGKSSLALQLIDRGAILVADDQTQLTYEEGRIVAQAPQSIKGLLEVRGLGLIFYPFQERALLGLSVEICEKDTVERLPDPSFFEYYDLRVPLLKLVRDDPLGAIKIELKVRQINESKIT